MIPARARARAARSVLRAGIREEATGRRLLEAFGPDNLRVELQRPYLRGDRALNRMLEDLARRLGVP